MSVPVPPYIPPALRNRQPPSVAAVEQPAEPTQNEVVIVQPFRNSNIVGIEMKTGAAVDAVHFEMLRGGRYFRFSFGGLGGGPNSVHEQWLKEPRNVFVSNIQGASYRSTQDGRIFKHSCYHLQVTLRFADNNELCKVVTGSGDWHDGMAGKIERLQEKNRLKYGPSATAEYYSFSKDFLIGDMVDFEVGTFASRPQLTTVAAVK